MPETLSLFQVQIWKARHVGDAVRADIVQRVQASDTTHALYAAMRFHRLTFAHIVLVSPSSSRQGFDSWYDVSCPAPTAPSRLAVRS